MSDYRVRYCGRNFAEAQQALMQLDAAEDAIDQYLLQFWPAASAPDAIIEQTEAGAGIHTMWHADKSERPAPPPYLDLDYEAPFTPPAPRSRNAQLQARRRALYQQPHHTDRPASEQHVECEVTRLGCSDWAKVLIFAGDLNVFPPRAILRKIIQGRPALAKYANDAIALWVPKQLLRVATSIPVSMDVVTRRPALALQPLDDVFTVPFLLTDTDGPAAEVYIEGDCWRPEYNEFEPSPAVLSGLTAGSYELLVIAAGRDALEERIQLYLYPAPAARYEILQAGSEYARFVADPTADAPPSAATRFDTSHAVFLSGYRSRHTLMQRARPGTWEPIYSRHHWPVMPWFLFGADEDLKPSGVGGFSGFFPGVIGVLLETHRMQVTVTATELTGPPITIGAGLKPWDDAIMLSTMAQNGEIELFDDTGTRQGQISVGVEATIGLRIVVRGSFAASRLVSKRRTSKMVSPEWIEIQWWPLREGEMILPQTREVSPSAEFRALTDRFLLEYREARAAAEPR